MQYGASQYTYTQANPLTSVELFAGIGGFRIASEKRGIKTVWANDIYHEACDVYRHNFGEDAICEGDIREHLNDIPSHDLLTGGFPCQPFSSAGKKKGIEDPRGTLFEVIVEVLKKNQPKYFILENVKRLLAMDNGLHFATILSALAELDYRIEWRLLNAMNFGLPQNRQRVVLLGMRLDQFNESDSWDNPSRIKLATSEDLSELSDRQYDALCDSSSWCAIEDHGLAFPTWGIACKGKFFAADLDLFSSALPKIKLKAVLLENVPPEFDLTQETLPRLQLNTEINKYVGGVEILSNQAGGARMGYTIFGVSGLAPTLTSSTSRHYERYKVGNMYRRLTDVEYARIQGFPDNHCDCVSLRFRYVLCGNAVPPPLVGWVMDRLLSTEPVTPRLVRPEPLTLFANAY